jgi:hypothetical protein
VSAAARDWVQRCRFDGGPPRARDVLLAVAWRAADADQPANAAVANPPVEIPAGHAVCWAAHEELATEAGCSDRTVRRVLRWAESAGLLARRRRARRDGQVWRRTADALLLDLAAEPLRVERDPGLSAKRAAAAAVRWERVRAVRAASGQVASASVQVGRIVEAPAEAPAVVPPAASLHEASGQDASGQRPNWTSSTSPTEPHTQDEHTPPEADGTTHQAAPQPPVDNPGPAAFEYFDGLPAQIRAQLLTPPVGDAWKGLRRLHRSDLDVYRSEVAVALWAMHDDLAGDWVDAWLERRDFTRDEVLRLVRAAVFRARQGRMAGAA